MNTKWLLVASALMLFVTGIVLTFMPEEIAGIFTTGGRDINPVILQMMGAMFFAFGMLNWMSKGSIIGGIYNRPVAIANVTHFFIGAMALIKGISKFPDHQSIMIICSVVYAIFALLFGIILFRHPGTDRNKNA